MHHVQPTAISLTQATELGTVYTPGRNRRHRRTGATPRHEAAHGRRALRQRAGRSWLHAGRADLEERRRRAFVRRDQERRAGRRGGRSSSIPRTRATSNTGARNRATCCRRCGSSRRSSRPISTDDHWLANARRANMLAQRLAQGLAQSSGDRDRPSRLGQCGVRADAGRRWRPSCARAACSSTIGARRGRPHAGATDAVLRDAGRSVDELMRMVRIELPSPLYGGGGRPLRA